jgi:mono/diheme cytochrome c family protein
MIAIAALAYASTAAVTAAPSKRANAHAQGLTRAAKLKNALKACKKQKSKSKRKRCETAAHKKYGATHKATTTTPGTNGTGTNGMGTPGAGTGNGTPGAATTGTGTGAGTTAAAGGTTGTGTTTTTGTGTGTTGATTGTATGTTGTTTGETEAEKKEKERKAAELTKARQASNHPSEEIVMKGKPLFANACASCHGPGGHGETGVPETNLIETCGCGNPIWPLALSVAGVMEELIEPSEEPHKKLNFDQMFTITEKEELGAWVCKEITQKFSNCA